MEDNQPSVPHFKNSENVDQYYDQWAEAYDHDLIDRMGYIVPKCTVDVFKKHQLDNNSLILDIGAGTGIVGECLQSFDYTNIEALDFSKGSVAPALAKDIYQKYHIETLGKQLEIESDSYDAIIGVGVFGPTHAPAHSFDELIRITKPQGLIVFTMREQEMLPEDDFAKMITKLEEDNKWELVEESQQFKGFTRSNPDLYFRTFVYQVL